MSRLAMWVRRSLMASMVILVAASMAHAAPLPGKPSGDPAPDVAEAVRLNANQQYEQAIVAAKRALARDERYVPAMIALADSYYYLKKYELASSIVGIAHGIDANNAEGYNLLGWIALARKDATSATQAFLKATQLKADYGNAWNSLAAMYLSAKNYDAAVPAAEKATQLLPKFDGAWINLGSAYRGKQRYTDAEQAYRKALSFSPRSADAWYNLGILYLDAPQMPNMDTVARLNTAIANLSKYRELSGSRLANDDPAGDYVEQAQKEIVREQKRLEREKAREAREKAKAAPAATPIPAAAPATPNGVKP